MTNEYIGDPDWTLFGGTAEQAPEGYILRPLDDDYIRITAGWDDVRVDRQFVFLRVGAYLLNVFIPWDSPVKKLKHKSKKPKCDGDTMCLGRVETCCSTQQVLGSCAGGWRCF